MKHSKTTAALVLGLLSLTLLAGCGRFGRAVATAAAGEALYDGAKSLAAGTQHNWRAGVPHPTQEGLVSSVYYGHYQPVEGRYWSNTRTREPRIVR